MPRLLNNLYNYMSLLQGLAALPAVSEWLKYCETYWQGKLIFALHSLLHGIKYRKNYNIFKLMTTFSYNYTCSMFSSDM